MSGGIDSPVAAWRMMRRGCRVQLIHFHSYPIVSAVSQEKARRLAEVLTRYQQRTRLYLVPFGEVQRRVVIAVPAPLRVLVYRRLMLRIAERLARWEGARALVTGESVGQVASQTLENLTAIGSAATLPVFRPLIGMDKEEVTADAQRIGTYEHLDRARRGLLPAVHAARTRHARHHRVGRCRGGITASRRTHRHGHARRLGGGLQVPGGTIRGSSLNQPRGLMVFASVEALVEAVSSVARIDGDAITVTGTADPSLIDHLAHTSSFGATPEIKGTARWVIRALAAARGVQPASIHELYIAMGRGETGGFTVPAMNIRMMTYYTARAAIRAATAARAGAFIFEIARSEIGYTEQRPHEYAASVLAAALREGFEGPIFFQGDHVQVNAKKYASARIATRSSTRSARSSRKRSRPASTTSTSTPRRWWTSTRRRSTSSRRSTATCAPTSRSSSARTSRRA